LGTFSSSGKCPSNIEQLYKAKIAIERMWAGVQVSVTQKRTGKFSLTMPLDKTIERHLWAKLLLTQQY
jgi:hypothetical protein